MRRRGQFSLEFLLTYGWVIFIIIAGVSVIYSTGIFSFSDFLPEKCEFLGQISCIQANVASSSAGVGTANVTISNSFGVDLIVYNATLRDAFGVTCTGTSNPYVRWPLGSTVSMNISGCIGTKLIKNQRFDGDFLITFYRNNTWCNPSPANCLYTSVGQVLVKIN